MEWGAAIDVAGVRPAWLRDNDIIQWSMEEFTPDWEKGLNYVSPGVWSNRFTTIRLPASHIAYRAIAAGFEPWGGGGDAPADWDQSAQPNALWRDGHEVYHNNPLWQHDNNATDIIGYRKRAVTAPAKDDGDYVRVRRMTEDEARDRYLGYDMLYTLRDLGLIAPKPTQAERIAAATGISVADVERVIAAIGECGA